MQMTVTLFSNEQVEIVVILCEAYYYQAVFQDHDGRHCTSIERTLSQIITGPNSEKKTIVHSSSVKAGCCVHQSQKALGNQWL